MFSMIPNRVSSGAKCAMCCLMRKPATGVPSGVFPWRLVDEFRRHAGVDAYYDWQGGLIWMRMEAEPEADVLRKLIARHGGGHATLICAPERVRGSVDVFQPQPAALAALSARLKQQFDPENILNPGRMYPHQAGA